MTMKAVTDGIVNLGAFSAAGETKTQYVALGKADRASLWFKGTHAGAPTMTITVYEGIYDPVSAANIYATSGTVLMNALAFTSGSVYVYTPTLHACTSLKITYTNSAVAISAATGGIFFMEEL